MKINDICKYFACFFSCFFYRFFTCISSLVARSPLALGTPAGILLPIKYPYTF